tara:strand:- start:14 stop:421 length:408 start_codon:yes stop_codon:yes gene_type:complete
MQKGGNMSGQYESVEQLKSYFKARIEERRNYVSPIVKRVAERSGKEIKKKGLTDQQEQSLLNALERNITEILDMDGALRMYNDYEPQGFLRHICEDAGLSIGDFRYYVGLPTKLCIVISPLSLSLLDDGKPITLN